VVASRRRRCRRGDGPPRPPLGAPAPADAPPGDDRFAGLAERPVAEHVEVFENEHERLRRELGTIDQL